MRTRTFPTAQLELEQINVALRRAYPAKPPTFTRWHIIFVISLFLGCIALIPQKSPLPKVDPMADSIRNNILTRAAFRQHGVPIYLGELGRVEDLPKTGNHLGDYWKVGDHLWMWTVEPIGSTIPTWIDP